MPGGTPLFGTAGIFDRSFLGPRGGLGRATRRSLKVTLACMQVQEMQVGGFWLVVSKMFYVHPYLGLGK